MENKTKKTRILIVEDDKAYQEALKFALINEGFEVFTADKGESALNLTKNTNFDLILLVILMPGMDGIEFSYQMKKIVKKEIPIIILSNLTKAVYPADVKDYLIKANTSLEEIVAKVKEYLNTDYNLVPV